jgi:Glycine-zipper domain
MNSRMIAFILSSFMAVSGCATVPTGPNARVMPGPGKSFEQFQADDAACRQWAEQQTGQSHQDLVNQNTGIGAVVGTAAGAALGAAVGAASGHAGTGAAIGAGSGLLVGTAAGANAGQAHGMQAQRRYDIAYQQCMSAKGNQVPGAAPLPPPAMVETAPPAVVDMAPPPPVVVSSPPPPPPVMVSPAPPQFVFQAPPRFIYSPRLGFYVAVETPYDLVYVDGRYYFWDNGLWYASSYYNGPYVVVQARRVPPSLVRFRYSEIRRYRDSEYRVFLHDKKHYRGRWYVPEERRGHR